MKVMNISNKIIGIGEVTILPNETKQVPMEYVSNPIIDVYVEAGICVITEHESVTEQVKVAKKETKSTKKDEITDEEAGKLANELGINPADCKDMKDVKKKVSKAKK